jgi:homogentisate 1,2-dioxygenase
MPIYHRLGEVPRKRHSAFRRADGALCPEELLGSRGFSGPSSLLYHRERPTRVLESRHLRSSPRVAEPDPALRHRHFKTSGLPEGGSPTLGRTLLLFNDDVALSVARPAENDDFFYRNAEADELVFVAEGRGVLESLLGELPFSPRDYLVVPRGILHRYRLDERPALLLVVETAAALQTPARYRNEHGQLTEGSPFSERDIRVPQRLVTHDEDGRFRVVVKRAEDLSEIVVDRHPFDVVGWDGYYYPWALSMDDFEPRVGRFHLPPPFHQTFEASGAVFCSFCPRPFDFDPQAVPAPYNHSNVMCDEVLFYANAEFMSRKGIEYASLTLHPHGLPHGPHPGRAEESMGAARTDERAVMMDAFRPLRVAASARTLEDEEYFRSWLPEP